MKLLVNAVTKYLFGLIFVSLLLFIPAGTLAFVGGWLFIGLLFIPMLILGVVLFVKSPNLLEKRLNNREKESAQRGVIGVSLIVFLAVFLLAGLDHRFGWSDITVWLTVVSSVVLLLSYAMYAEVMRENAYLSRTVEIQDGQKIIDTGLYGIVRHPMYLASVLMFLSIPLVLGSWIALCVMAVYPVLIVVRILNEEKVLTTGLDGYEDYKKRVKYRLIPLIW